MISFKIKNKTYSVPGSWYEFTYQQYLDYVAACAETQDIIKIISVLSGIDHEFLKKHNVIGAENLIRCLHYLKQSPEFGDYTPKVGKYRLPVNSKGKFDIQFESLAQFEDMGAAVKKIPKGGFMELLEAYPVFCSIYLQKIRDGEYNYGAAMEMLPEVKQMPFPEVLVAGSFFFLHTLGLLSGTDPSSHPKKKIPKQSKQGSRLSLKRTGRTRK